VITEHEMLVTLANMALKMDDLTGHDVVEAFVALGHGGVIDKARAGAIVHGVGVHPRSGAQLHLFYPEKIPVDKMTDKSGRIQYIGDATYSHGEGFYKCLADVDGALCTVEVKISFEGRP